MLRSLSLRDFVIVRELELEVGAGFSALTGETGAGKSILIDALQLALGGRGDALVVREGAARADISARFDIPGSLRTWLDDGGFLDADADADDGLLLRRSVDAQGKSRAWINGSPATAAQLREAAEHLVDIHGQHAWQSLTRPAAVRALLDDFAGPDTVATTAAMAAAWQRWQQARQTLERATTQAGERERERERLAWQVGEVDKLMLRHGEGADEWAELNDEHKRLSHAQALIDAAQGASRAIADSEPDAALDAATLVAQAADAIEKVVDIDARLAPALEVLRAAQAHLDDAAHTLRGYLQHADLDPERLAALDQRLSTWMSLARRFKLPAADLAAQHAAWRAQLEGLDAASDVQALTSAEAQAARDFMREAKLVSAARAKAAPRLAQLVTAAMQDLGLAGGRFDVALEPTPEPQSFGVETAEFLVAGHAGTTPRPIAKVASGGELSRLALAIAVTTCGADTRASHTVPTLIFDEIDAGVGGSVADTVGQLMRRLGHDRQVLAVTHLAQVAASAQRHIVVTKAPDADGRTSSAVRVLADAEREHEIARMLGGEISNTSLAHAREMLSRAASDAQADHHAAPARGATRGAARAPRADGGGRPSARGADRKRA
jgi:DNA repair protein RecN (Recombination protein N)